MNGIDYQLAKLRESLAQEEEVLAAISNPHNHEEIRQKVESLKAGIKELEEWKQKQKQIRKTEMCQRCVKNLEHLEYLDRLRNDVDHRIADKVIKMTIPSEVLDDEMRDLIKLRLGQRNERTVEEGGRTFDMSDLKCGEARDGGPRRNPARRHPTKKPGNRNRMRYGLCRAN